MIKHVGEKIGKWVLFFLGIAIVIGIILLVTMFSTLTSYIEVKEIGSNFLQVFWTDFSSRAFVQSITFAVLFACIFLNLIYTRQNLLIIDPHFHYLKSRSWMIAGSAAVAFLFTSWVSGSMCNTVLPFLNSQSFNFGDPVFHRDVGYYVFKRQFMMSVVYGCMHVALVGFITSIVCYIVNYFAFDFYNIKKILRERKIISHCIVNLMILFVIKALAYQFEAQNLLFQQNKDFTGINYVGMRVWYNYFKIAPFILIAVVIVSLFFFLKNKKIKSLICMAIFPTFWLITLLIAYSTQLLVVAPNQLAAESKYIEYNINCTREAYGLSGIQTMNFEANYDLKNSDISKNTATVNNIRIADIPQMLQSTNQLQGLRNYYKFSDANIVNYQINGQDTAVMLSARELDINQLDDTTKSNYINLRMKYTHGCGIVMNPVNKITDQGQPYYIIKDIPVRSMDGAPQIVQPRIYFGESTNHYVIVNTKDKELDDIDGSYSYAGSAGIRMNLFNRILYSIKYADFKLLISNQISGNSKLLTNRNVVSRARKAFPYLKYDDDAHILVDSEGRLKWIIDAYVTSDKFPCAQKQENKYSYIRNSVKVVIDAYDGSVKFYIVDPNEPIIKSYAKIYPKVFESDPLPADLASHSRYPKGLFRIQADVFRKYHITNVSDFYQNKGLWAFCREKYGEKLRDVDPNYGIMKLVNSDPNVQSKEEFVLTLPYTIINKDNMISWLACKCNFANYGQMILYQFPNNKNIYGTHQIESRIDSDPDISREMTLWGQRGSTVIRGTILVIPIEKSLLYVEPVYISSGQESALPEMKRVIVVYGEKIVMQPTLGEALVKLFGASNNTPTTVVPTLSADEIINEITQIYSGLKESAKNFNWPQFGQNLTDLENAVLELKERIKEQQNS